MAAWRQLVLRARNKSALSESTKKGSFNDDSVAWLVVATSSANGFSQDLAGATTTLGWLVGWMGVEDLACADRCRWVCEEREGYSQPCHCQRGKSRRGLDRAEQGKISKDVLSA